MGALSPLCFSWTIDNAPDLSLLRVCVCVCVSYVCVVCVRVDFGQGPLGYVWHSTYVVMALGPGETTPSLPLRGRLSYRAWAWTGQNRGSLGGEGFLPRNSPRY